jgi:tetratricopeptide (TPR) repeat protein
MIHEVTRSWLFVWFRVISWIVHVRAEKHETKDYGTICPNMFPLQKLLITVICTLLLALSIAAQSPQLQTAIDYDKAGFAAQQGGKFEDALQLYAAALKLNPKDWIAHANSGVCYMALRKFENAVTAFKAAVALVPTEPRLQLNLGDAYAISGQSLEAIDAYKEAIRLDPKMVEAYAQLARFYGHLGRNDDALRLA